MMVTEVLVKGLAHLLNHVHKIFNCRLSFFKIPPSRKAGTVILNMIWHVLQKVVKCYFVQLPRLSYIYWLIHFEGNIWKPTSRSNRPEVLLVKGVLKICSKFTGEHPCRSAILIKLQGNSPPSEQEIIITNNNEEAI